MRHDNPATNCVFKLYLYSKLKRKLGLFLRKKLPGLRRVPLRAHLRSDPSYNTQFFVKYTLSKLWRNIKQGCQNDVNIIRNLKASSLNCPKDLFQLYIVKIMKRRLCLMTYLSGKERMSLNFFFFFLYISHINFCLKDRQRFWYCNSIVQWPVVKLQR